MRDSHGCFKIVDKVVNNGQLSLVSDDGHVVGRVYDGGTSLNYSLAWDFGESECEHRVSYLILTDVLNGLKACPYQSLANRWQETRSLPKNVGISNRLNHIARILSARYFTIFSISVCAHLKLGT